MKISVPVPKAFIQVCRPLNPRTRRATHKGAFFNYDVPNIPNFESLNPKVGIAGSGEVS